MISTFVAFGDVAAFAPSWDRYILQTSDGARGSLSAANVFSKPAPVIAGNVAVMVAFVAVFVAAALWRPILDGAVLLAGALSPMIAQAISTRSRSAGTPPRRCSDLARGSRADGTDDHLRPNPGVLDLLLFRTGTDSNTRGRGPRSALDPDRPRSASRADEH
jgi:hypothetical protein